MKRLRLPVARRAAHALGGPGALGLGLAAVAAVFFMSAVVPLHHRIDTARDRVNVLLTLAAPARAPRPAPPNLNEQLAAFYRIFPLESEAPRWIRTIAGAASHAGLQLHEAEYQALRDRGGKLLRLSMHLPLRGEYRQIRQFLGELRAAVPVASLEQVAFERQKIGDPQIDAKLTLVVFLGTVQ